MVMIVRDFLVVIYFIGNMWEFIVKRSLGMEVYRKVLFILRE